MIKAIDKKYCTDNLVQVKCRADTCNFIVSPDEIILLKNGSNILINKYNDYQNRINFNDSEKNKEGDYYKELFKYDKLYLNLRSSVNGYSFSENYLFKGTDRALFYDVSLPIDQRCLEENVLELSRREIENLFDKDMYDSMYVIDINGRIMFANNKKDGLVINKFNIPNDKEIISLDLEKRVSDKNMGRLARRIMHATGESYIEKEIKDVIKPRKISEIKDLKLYGSFLFDRYANMLLTSKNGVFNLKWFKLTFVSRDKFRLTYSDIPVIVPTVDDVIDYAREHDIEDINESNYSKFIKLVEARNSNNDELVVGTEVQPKKLEDKDSVKKVGKIKKLIRQIKKNI